jgi:hypothetical protein
MAKLRDPATRRFFLDSYIGHFNERVTGLAHGLSSGQLSISAYELAMRQEIKYLHTNALIIAYGGERGAISFAEWGRLGGHLRTQYAYLHRYTEAVQQNALGALMGQNKPFSEKYLANRGKLYGGAARASFYRGLAMGLLPQVPGDGQTICLTSCQCELVFETDDDYPGLLLVFWKMTPGADHCADCVSLQEQWNPYELWLPVGLSAREWVTWLPKMKAIQLTI